MSRFKVLNSDNLENFWGKIVSLIEFFTGKVSSDGTLQEQIDKIKKDVNANNVIHVFDILLREKMISEQEYYRAINKIKEKYNTIYKNDN